MIEDAFDKFIEENQNEIFDGFIEYLEPYENIIF
jgi:hypothetical protein